MDIGAVSSSVSAYTNPSTQTNQSQQAEQTQQAQQARAVETRQARTERPEERQGTQPKPVVNAFGQKTGTLINETA